jgi:hypothetical protein
MPECRLNCSLVEDVFLAAGAAPNERQLTGCRRTPAASAAWAAGLAGPYIVVYARSDG